MECFVQLLCFQCVLFIPVICQLLFFPMCISNFVSCIIPMCIIFLRNVFFNCYFSGGRLCTLIGVPWRGVSFSTLSRGRFVLKQYICKGAESAEHAETAGYTYEGTPTTA